MEQSIGIWHYFWLTYREVLVCTLLSIPALIVLFGGGNICCPDKVTDLTERFPFALRIFINGLVGIPLYLIGFMLGGFLLMLIPPISLLRTATKPSGIVKVNSQSRSNEAQTYTQVDLDE
jgi:hypothetical protein